MKKNRWYLRLLALLVLCGALNVTITAAAEAGSSDDPLVTLSYLNETFMDSIMERVDQKIADRNAQLGISAGSGAGAASNFTVVTLTSGQVLTGDIGCEVMLRVGTAVCVSPSSPGLIDETAATALNNGSALVQNHLYMMTIEGRGVRATAGTTKLLVRGSYTVACSPPFRPRLAIGCARRGRLERGQSDGQVSTDAGLFLCGGAHHGAGGAVHLV